MQTLVRPLIAPTRKHVPLSSGRHFPGRRSGRHLRSKRGIRLQAQLRLAHGSLRDPTLTVLGAQGQKDSRRKHWICANLSKAAGHQMASTIKILRRKPLILRGKSHRSIGEFMGVNLWKHGQFWRVPPRRICIASVPISSTLEFRQIGDVAASRSDPTFTRASQGLRQ